MRITGCSLFRVFVCLALACLASNAYAEGRWKWDGSQCYWDESDSGPDQCDPNNPPPPTGRYKIEAGCVWDPNDSGPDQCDPFVPPTEQPEATEQTVPEIDFGDALSEGAGYSLEGGWLEAQGQSFPSCASYVKHGNWGYISAQTGADGSLQWGAYPNDLWNSAGYWFAAVHVNGVQRDLKQQLYPPHGSLPSSIAPPGSIITIIAGHVFFYWFVYEYYFLDGWHTIGYWRPAVASGGLNCIMPPL